MVEYTGYTDCRIEENGKIHFPASSLYDERGEAVVCLWTPLGYVPRDDNHPDWLADYLDEDGALR